VTNGAFNWFSGVFTFSVTFSHFSNKSTSGQALKSPIRFVARSSADEWDNIIPYDRNRSD
jgi:hypothetical protein